MAHSFPAVTGGDWGGLPLKDFVGIFKDGGSFLVRPPSNLFHAGKSGFQGYFFMPLWKIDPLLHKGSFFAPFITAFIY